MLRIILIVMLCFLIMPFFSAEAEEEFRIIYPPEKSALEEGVFEVVGTVPSGVKEVKFSVSNGKAPGDRTVRVENGTFSKLVELKRGECVIEVKALDSELESVEVEAYVLRRGETSKAGYRRFYRHDGISVMERCSECHETGTGKESYRMIKPVSTCGTGNCHSDMGRKQYVHGPVGAGVCIHCHNPHGSFDENELSREDKSLCLVCHVDAESFWKKSNIHYPLDAGECTGCHSPHESEVRYQLLHDSESELCFECHGKEAITGGEVVHTPVQMLECSMCHDPHSTDHAALLSADGNEACYSCHSDKKEEFEDKSLHMIVFQGCTECHNAHSSNHPNMLFAAEDKFCMECHKDMTPDFAAKLEQVTVGHEPVQEGRCGECHDAHASAHSSLLKASSEEICFICHKEMGAQVKASEYQHGPVEGGDCGSCHLTHGATQPNLLTKYFPDEFYVSYDEENYALCFDCHSSDIAKKARTDDMTGFRNGDRNLHYVHVNKERKGRSCKACHEIHAGSQRKHIREEVPYGKMWSYPIKYTKTETGGGCIVGCHKPFDYDRKNPVSYR